PRPGSAALPRQAARAASSARGCTTTSGVNVKNSEPFLRLLMAGHEAIQDNTTRGVGERRSAFCAPSSRLDRGTPSFAVGSDPVFALSVWHFRSYPMSGPARAD